MNLIDNEIDCIGIVDTRDKPKNVIPKIKVYTNSQVINAYGNLKLQSVDVINFDGKIII